MAALTVAFFRALVDADVERSYAIELTADVSWRVLAPAARIAAAATARPGDTPAARLRRRVDLITFYPFGRPAFEFATRDEPRGRALDMHRCPIADYMKAHAASDVCVGAWCNADFALAEVWDARLHRDGTLAGGAPCCDFRFVVDAEAQGAGGVRSHSPGFSRGARRARC